MEQYKNKIIFFSDLDNTLIYSKRKCLNKEKEYIPIAINKKGENHSFIEKGTQDFINILMESNKIEFIPTTVRNLNSYNRSKFSKNSKINFAIINFGRTILYKNKILNEYEKYMKKLYKNIKLDNLYIKVSNFILENISKEMEIKIIENSYINISYNKLEEDEKFNNFFKKTIKEQFLTKEYYLHHNDTSFAILPIFLNKQTAVEFIIKKLHPSMTIGAGDNKSDINFLKITDFMLIPNKSQISEVI